MEVLIRASLNRRLPISMTRPLMRTRIKICGLSTPEHVRIACNAGADAIGLIFYPQSRRYLELEQAGQVSRSASAIVSKVGVFVNPSTAFVKSRIKAANLDMLQFHGTEDAAFCASFDLPYIKAIRVQHDTDLSAAEGRYHGAHALLLDSAANAMWGGSGEQFDWNLARYRHGLPVYLAGGLDADNVEQAMKSIRPFAVDVSSGVETGGRKDADKIRSFCQRVIAADGSLVSACQ